MIAQWEPEAIVTAGDNSQGNSACKAFTQSVGAYYGQWMSGPQGPRLWPALGNHDYDDASAGLANYRAFFPYLPTTADPQGRWYAKTLGRITFYFIDSNATVDVIARQRLWLKEALRANAAHSDWQIVVMHHPPYTTGAHDIGTDERPDLRPGDGGFNYQAWGADLVIAGHQHIYEDVIRDGFHYLTVGPGAQELARVCRAARVAGSRLCLENAGALRIVADAKTLTIEYRQPTVAPGAGTTNKVADTIRLTRS